MANASSQTKRVCRYCHDQHSRCEPNTRDPNGPCQRCCRKGIECLDQQPSNVQPCEACRQIKANCRYNDNGSPSPCRRCEKKEIQCVMPDSSRKRPMPSQAHEADANFASTSTVSNPLKKAKYDLSRPVLHEYDILVGRFAGERANLIKQHRTELAHAREDGAVEATSILSKKREEELLFLIHFLYTAAVRTNREEIKTEEDRAFDGALLLVYQGNDIALTALKDLIAGSSKKVTSEEGELLEVTFAQIKQSSTVDAAPFQEPPNKGSEPPPNPNPRYCSQ